MAPPILYELKRKSLIPRPEDWQGRKPRVSTNAERATRILRDTRRMFPAAYSGSGRNLFRGKVAAALSKAD